MANIAATKGNLMAAKSSRDLAYLGYDLMDKKRNVLIREMMDLMEVAKDLQKRINITFSEAYASMRIAEVMTGGAAEVAAKAVPIDKGVEIRYRSVMGVDVPIVKLEEQKITEPPYSLSGTNMAMDGAFFKFQELKKLTAELAETENTIYRLAYAIRKAQKRANALQNIVIPEKTAEIQRISEALEENQREEFVRMKLVKWSKG